MILKFKELIIYFLANQYVRIILFPQTQFEMSCRSYWYLVYKSDQYVYKKNYIFVMMKIRIKYSHNLEFPA